VKSGGRSPHALDVRQLKVKSVFVLGLLLALVFKVLLPASLTVFILSRLVCFRHDERLPGPIRLTMYMPVGKSALVTAVRVPRSGEGGVSSLPSPFMPFYVMERRFAEARGESLRRS
jgi:hypothetical protein